MFVANCTTFVPKSQTMCFDISLSDSSKTSLHYIFISHTETLLAKKIFFFILAELFGKL